MSKRALLPVAAALALFCGCAGKEQIYFRPIGDTILYSYTYYPELPLVIPPDCRPTAGATVAARGIIENENGIPTLIVKVRVVIYNPTDRSIKLHRERQYIADIDGGLQPASRMTTDWNETDLAAIGPGGTLTLRLEFNSGIGPPFDERLTFVYRFRYNMYGRTWPEDVEFVQVMPGEIIPPPIWDGVIIIRF